jgi:hypothetical protein
MRPHRPYKGRARSDGPHDGLGFSCSWVIDPTGRTVELTRERWMHIISRHPYMEAYVDDIMRAITEPTTIIRRPRSEQDWYYLAGAGPSAWLKVVVAFDESANTGIVRTAFPRRTKP